MGGVDEYDHLAKALGLHQREQVLLVLGELQIAAVSPGLGVARRLHIHGQVAALAADAGEHHHRRVGERLGVCQKVIAVLVRGHLGGGEVGAGKPGLIPPLYAGVFVEVHQLLVDLQSGVGEALHQVHVGGGVAGAAARAAVQGGHGGVAEQVYLGAALQGQGVIPVFQQDDALGSQLLGHSQGSLLGLLWGELLRRGGAVGPGQAAVQVRRHESIDGGEHLNTHHVDNERDHQQDADDYDGQLAVALCGLLIPHSDPLLMLEFSA